LIISLSFAFFFQRCRWRRDAAFCAVTPTPLPPPLPIYVSPDACRFFADAATPSSLAMMAPDAAMPRFMPAAADAICRCPATPYAAPLCRRDAPRFLPPIRVMPMSDADYDAELIACHFGRLRFSITDTDSFLALSMPLIAPAIIDYLLLL
jgi:hypothetical protein